MKSMSNLYNNSKHSANKSLITVYQRVIPHFYPNFIKKTLTDTHHMFEVFFSMISIFAC